MEYLKFEKKITQLKSKALHVFAGPESFLRSEALLLLKKNIGEESLFYKEYNGNEGAKVDSIMMDLASDALFDDFNLIIVKEADSILGDLVEPLKKYMEGPNENSILVVDLQKLDKRSKFAKFVDKKGVLVECNSFFDRPKPWLNLPPWESDLVRWVVGRAKHHRKKITSETAFLLTEAIGNSLKDLDSQLQKIATSISDKPQIANEDVERMVKNSKRGSAFDLLDTISACQLPQSLKIAQQIFTNGLEGKDGQAVYDHTHIALQIIRLIHYRLRQLWKVSVSKDPAGIPEYARRKLVQNVQHFPEAKLIRCWQELLETEHLLKTSKVTPALGVEQLILRFTTS